MITYIITNYNNNYMITTNNYDKAIIHTLKQCLIMIIHDARTAFRSFVADFTKVLTVGGIYCLPIFIPLL